MDRSYVVTGGGRGIGRAIVERLARDGGYVVTIETDPDAVSWFAGHDAADRLSAVIGNAAEEAVTEEAADRAEAAGLLAGWVNNAAVFRDATLDEAGPRTVLDLITANLGPAVTGCATAVRRYLAAGGGGAIVNVSSHQARRPVRHALPYATAKAAVEGLTKAAAVDYGHAAIRVNAVALGSFTTERYEAHLTQIGEVEAARTIEQMAELHPLRRVGRVDEAADAVVYLLSDAAGFISGAVLPVDGGRSAKGLDPEGG